LIANEILWSMLKTLHVKIWSPFYQGLDFYKSQQFVRLTSNLESLIHLFTCFFKAAEFFYFFYKICHLKFITFACFVLPPFFFLHLYSLDLPQLATKITNPLYFRLHYLFLYIYITIGVRVNLYTPRLIL